jgi:hypothetical protein
MHRNSKPGFGFLAPGFGQTFKPAASVRILYADLPKPIAEARSSNFYED